MMSDRKSVTNEGKHKVSRLVVWQDSNKTSIYFLYRILVGIYLIQSSPKVFVGDPSAEAKMDSRLLMSGMTMFIIREPGAVNRGL